MTKAPRGNENNINPCLTVAAYAEGYHDIDFSVQLRPTGSRPCGCSSWECPKTLCRVCHPPPHPASPQAPPLWGEALPFEELLDPPLYSAPRPFSVGARGWQSPLDVLAAVEDGALVVVVVAVDMQPIAETTTMARPVVQCCREPPRSERQSNHGSSWRWSRRAEAVPSLAKGDDCRLQGCGRERDYCWHRCGDSEPEQRGGPGG